MYPLQTYETCARESLLVKFLLYFTLVSLSIDRDEPLRLIELTQLLNVTKTQLDISFLSNTKCVLKNLRIQCAHYI